MQLTYCTHCKSSIVDEHGNNINKFGCSLCDDCAAMTFEERIEKFPELRALCERIGNLCINQSGLFQ